MAMYRDDVFSVGDDGRRGDADHGRRRRGAHRPGDRAAAGAGGARLRAPRHAGRHRRRRRRPSGSSAIAMTDVVTRRTPSGPGDVGFETVTGMSDATRPLHAARRAAGEYVLEHANRFLSRALRTGPAGVLDCAARDRRHGRSHGSHRHASTRRFASKAGSSSAAGTARQPAPPRIAGGHVRNAVRRAGASSPLEVSARRDAVVLHRRRRRPVHRPALRARRLVRAIGHAGRQGHHRSRRSICRRTRRRSS